MSNKFRYVAVRPKFVIKKHDILAQGRNGHAVAAATAGKVVAVSWRDGGVLAVQ